MALTDSSVSVIEQCQVSPQPGTVPEFCLPLTFIDILMLDSWPSKSLYFYQSPISKHQFMGTIIPALKNSLSATLSHFLILAGNLIIPSSSDSENMPKFRYVDGGSVSVTFAEVDSVDDFHRLSGDHQRNCSELLPLATERPPPSVDAASGSTVVPLLALQVTLYPETGICIGVNAHHVAVDGSSIHAFLQAWAWLSKLNENASSSLPSDLMPSYDRAAMEERNELRDIFWSQMKIKLKQNSNQEEPGPVPDNTTSDLVQATFVLGKNDVQRLKNVVTSNQQQQALPHLSTFTVVCAYLWICIERSRYATADGIEEDPLYLFVFSADARRRLRPSIPANYFGNCLAFCATIAQASQLRAEEGLVTAAELIAAAIRERLHNEEGIFKGAEEWLPRSTGPISKQFVGVSGSHRLDYLSLDFGWGKAKKVEVVLNFETGVLFIGQGRQPGDVEIGLCFSKKRMDTFTVSMSALESCKELLSELLKGAQILRV